jgi:transcriptional regulator with XRE-family HTH domain
VLSQASAGEQIGRSRGWWHLLEAGRLSPQLCDLEAIASLLGVSVAELLEPGMLAAEGTHVERRAFLGGILGMAAVGSLDLERLARPAIDAGYVAVSEAYVDGLMTAWYTVPTCTLLPAVSGQMNALMSLLPGSRALSSVAGKTAVLAGHCLSKSERLSEAYSVYSLAQTLARDVGDDGLLAFALAARSAMHSTVARGD